MIILSCHFLINSWSILLCDLCFFASGSSTTASESAALLPNRSVISESYKPPCEDKVSKGTGSMGSAATRIFAVAKWWVGDDRDPGFLQHEADFAVWHQNSVGKKRPRTPTSLYSDYSDTTKAHVSVFKRIRRHVLLKSGLMLEAADSSVASPENNAELYTGTPEQKKRFLAAATALDGERVGKGAKGALQNMADWFKERKTHTRENSDRAGKPLAPWGRTSHSGPESESHGTGAGSSQGV